MLNTQPAMDRHARIAGIVAGQLGLDQTQLADHTDLRADLGADALDMAEILFALGRLYRRGVLPPQVQGMATIHEIRTFDQLLTMDLVLSE